MVEQISLIDIFGGNRKREPLPEVEWVKFDKPGITVEGRVTYVNVRWDEQRNRRRATLILETEDGNRVGISGSWTTFVRLIQKANLAKDDRVKITYLGTLAQVEVTDPEYAEAFKQAYESYMNYLKRRGRNIKYTKPPAMTKLFGMEILERAPDEETEEQLQEVAEQLEQLGD